MVELAAERLLAAQHEPKGLFLRPRRYIEPKISNNTISPLLIPFINFITIYCDLFGSTRFLQYEAVMSMHLVHRLGWASHTVQLGLLAH